MVIYLNCVVSYFEETEEDGDASIEDSKTLESLVEGLHRFFAADKESVNVDEVGDWIDQHKLPPADWEHFATWDKFRYTRNLMDQGKK